MNKTLVFLVLTSLVIGIVSGYALFAYWPLAAPSSHVQVSPSERENGAPQVLFYRNPMNPAVTSAVPAKDSMGMDYVPVYAQTPARVAGAVEIDSVVAQNMGVRSAKVQAMSLGRVIMASGRVAYDEERMIHLHPKVDGWIEEIRVGRTGQRVNSDDILLSLYSPKLVAAQQEYLLAIENIAVLQRSPVEQIRQGAQDLLASARERLQLLDVPEHQIHELEQSGVVKKNLHIHAPWGGTVVGVGARAGQFVTPITELYRLVDLTRVWVYADIFDYELPWVKPGDRVTMTTQSVPGETFSGELAYIYPYANAKTRTTQVRIVFDNSEGLLRPEALVDVRIASDERRYPAVIPAEAVVGSGSGPQVFVVKAAGKFEPRQIVTGIEADGFVAVVKGLAAEEQVVTSAQFLIDSESKLREAMAKMLSPSKGTTPPAMHEHHHD